MFKQGGPLPVVNEVINPISMVKSPQLPIFLRSFIGPILKVPLERDMFVPVVLKGSTSLHCP